MKHVVTTPTAPFESADGRLTIHQVPSFEDNLIWILVCNETGDAGVVDGPRASEALAYCEAQGLRLTTVFNTHTHGDHVGINLALQASGALSSMRVYGPGRAAKDVPGLTDGVDEGDEVQLGSVKGRVLLTEGHINGHVSYLFDDVLFCGDTLFAGGCGYLFDGPPSKMFESLSRLSMLDPKTRVCCAHEYTQDNLRFAYSVEPDNAVLQKRIADTWTLRGKGGCAVPSTIGLERDTNPFLRQGSETLRAAVEKAFPERDLGTDAELFAATRALKDRRDYRSITDAELPLA